MSCHFPRLQRALQRQGIQIAREGGIVRLERQADGSRASVLLPERLPLEQKAIRQLLDFAAVRAAEGDGHVCRACATPDFHPGSIAPVGSVVATTPDLVIPAAIGTDINCGMRLLRTGLTLQQVEAKREPLLAALARTLLDNGRDVPLRASAFTALFDAGPLAWIDTLHQDGLWCRVDRERLVREVELAVGLAGFTGAARHAPSALMPSSRDIVRDPNLGTVGAGNHFVELQIVDRVLDRHTAYACGLRADEIVVMIHSGSREVGFFVGQRWMDRARAAWPAGRRHPQSGLYGLSGELADDYLDAMGSAARYAWANRVVLAELVRDALVKVFGQDDSALVVDVPHNVVMRQYGLNIHRKGATPADAGELALIPGSMGDYSYLANGLGNPEWLWSCSHGSGRAMRRQAVRAQRPQTAAELPWHCVTRREERRIEEAPGAYKPIGPVIEAQESAGLIAPIARLRPWVTFKA
ncbi:RtcB family protein [Chitinimonas lacunae]|uniref:tRNA-splicing ligase RtcB n=1 Tax=Chitinimonas lacunae TaxID=1963018 RepID=A0ABV8MQN1_9NEIS